MSAKRDYEAVVIFHPDLDERAVQAEAELVQEFVRSRGGEMTRHEVWGRQQLSYPLKKAQFGTYVLFVFSADGSLVSLLERQMRISDRVLRWMVVSKDKNAPDWSSGSHFDRGRSSGAFGDDDRRVIDDGDIVADAKA